MKGPIELFGVNLLCQFNKRSLKVGLGLRKNDSNFKKGIQSILSKNPYVIGVCCGSTPRHLKILKQLIETRYSK